ncbi:MAG: prolyl oligopeptidase family serine peptidase [Gemmatimonadota bacterium]|nr:prolyl oligopeptidase family serine peptidase [Gemmatimonadota bacterium]
MMRSTCRALGLILLAAARLSAQQSVEADKALLATERYIRPPAEVAKLVTAPRQLNSTLTQQSPDKAHFLVVHGEGLGIEAKFAKPHYYFGGLQVDYRANRLRSFTSRGQRSFEIVDALSGARVSVKAPEGTTMSSPSWSPNGMQLAYFVNFDDASYVYVADARSGASRRLSGRAALPVLSTSLAWTPDGNAVYSVMIPSPRMPMPKEAIEAEGPIVRMTGGAKNKTPTYASLMQTPLEKAQLEYYATGQLARVDMKGVVKAIGAPALIDSIDVAPDGEYLRVGLIQKPFSYLVPVTAFGAHEELWSSDGRVIATLTRRPLRESDASGGDDAASGRGGAASDSAKRAFTWAPSGGLAYLAQDPAPRRARGAVATAAPVTDSSDAAPTDSARGPRRKDRLFVWSAPFVAGSAKPVAESDNRIAGFVYTADGKWVLLSEVAGTATHTYAIQPSDPSKRHTIFRAVGAQAGFGGGRGAGGGGRGGASDDAFYANPGTVVLRQTAGGRTAVVSADGKSVFLEGTHYAKDAANVAPRTFVDKVDLATGTKTRLFESDTALFESAPVPVDNDFSKFVVTRETEKVVPDQWLRDRNTGQLKQLTENKDVTPDVTGMTRRSIQVTRADGKTLWVNVTFPPGYREGTRLPAMFWFYPYEYADQESYDHTKRTLNKHKFPTAAPRSIEIMATQGYAIVQPDIPIFGTAGRLNDNYVNDLRNGLTAVIDELDKRGIIDRGRLGIGGHSYGAFSTVNAMVNLPYFKAGIAGDGNYNRTLTPNGFQSERRDLWEARETYLAMSPFLYADRLQGALLMYHSLEDQNTGTDPSNSVRLFHALQGMGKQASLYMYPYEDHGPLIEETLLDQWGRWVAWLDLYVKNAGAKAPTTALVP